MSDQDEFELGLDIEMNKYQRTILVHAIRYAKGDKEKQGDNLVALRYYVDLLFERRDQLKQLSRPFVLE